MNDTNQTSVRYVRKSLEFKFIIEALFCRENGLSSVINPRWIEEICDEAPRPEFSFWRSGTCTHHTLLGTRKMNHNTILLLGHRGELIGQVGYDCALSTSKRWYGTRTTRVERFFQESLGEAVTRLDPDSTRIHIIVACFGNPHRITIIQSSDRQPISNAFRMVIPIPIPVLKLMEIGRHAGMEKPVEVH